MNRNELKQNLTFPFNNKHFPIRERPPNRPVGLQLRTGKQRGSGAKPDAALRRLRRPHPRLHRLPLAERDRPRPARQPNPTLRRRARHAGGGGRRRPWGYLH